MSRRYRFRVRAGDAFLVPGDIHFNTHDAPAVDATVRFFTEEYHGYRRGVVPQGDTLDCWGVSRYPKAAARLAARSRVADEVAAARPFLRWAGSQPLGCTLIPGNHEDRLADALDEHPALHGCPGTRLGELTGLSDVRGLEILDHGSWVLLGDWVAICHGDADRFPKKAHLVAAKYPRQTTLFGHTHQISSHMTTIYDANGEPHVTGAYNVGHLCDVEQQDYTSDPSWQQGFAVVSFHGDRGDGRPFFRVDQRLVVRDRHGRAVVA